MLVFHTKKFPSFIYFKKLTKKNFLFGICWFSFCYFVRKSFFFYFPVLCEKYGTKSNFVSLTLFYPGKSYFILKNCRKLNREQSRNTISAMQTMFKLLGINWKIWGHLNFPHPHFPHTSSSSSSSLFQKHNIFMKTYTKQKRSRFKFKVFHCWNWNVFFCKYLVCSSFSTNSIFVWKTVDFLSELLDFFVHWNGKIFWWKWIVFFLMNFEGYLWIGQQNS